MDYNTNSKTDNGAAQVQHTRLTKTDIAAIDYRAQAEIDAILGAPPSMNDLQDESRGAQWLQPVLRLINALAMMITLVSTETIQAGGAILLLLAFGVLESERILSGAAMLGLDHTQAAIAAVAVVSANIILPVYAFRALRDKDTVTRTRHTARGFFMAFWRRLTNQPQDYTAAANSNPTLRTFESAATWAALSFALLAVLGDILAAHDTGRWFSTIAAVFTESTMNQMLQFIGGFLLSVVGVMGLQSVSHELAVRAHEERPTDLSAILEQRQREYREAAAAIREDVTADHMAAKLADKARKDAAKSDPTPTSNGRNNGHGF